MIEDFLPDLSTKMSKEQATQLNPLVLAFIGDAVQTLYVRTKLVFLHDFKANKLQQFVASEINANNQSKYIDEIYDLLTEEEKSIFKRARNSKVQTVAKNATVQNYKKASGLEAIIGYLYLIGSHDRLKYLLEVKIEKENTENVY